MARYAREGVRVVLVCATRGEAGDILNPRMDKPGVKESLAEVRTQELDAACALLGVEQVYHLGYRDSGMPGSDANAHPRAFCNADPDEVLRKLVRIIRAERPEVVLAYDESKGYEHPDHVAVHRWGTEAYQAAGDPQRYPDEGDPWQAQKLYYFATFSKARYQKLQDAAIAEGIGNPYEDRIEKWDSYGFVEPEITTQVDVKDFIKVRSSALLAHATQIDPDGYWFVIPDELQERAYPWEDYTLIDSNVPTELPESDLFAGIKPA